jgi:hypothetical protein
VLSGRIEDGSSLEKPAQIPQEHAGAENGDLGHLEVISRLDDVEIGESVFITALARVNPSQEHTGSEPSIGGHAGPSQSLSDSEVARFEGPSGSLQ